MTVFDLVVLLLLANAIQNVMVGPDSLLPGGILAAGRGERAVDTAAGPGVLAT
jgi:hypothetical protein